MTKFVSPDDIRLAFSDAMSAMYRAEVPLYGKLLEIVAQENSLTLEADPALYARLRHRGELDRLNAERHGAIRVGTPDELRLMRRLLAVMGMHPVGYYDLAPAGLPVHSTAFRPTSSAALSRCAFRIFCSLLRLDMIGDAALREQAESILSQRQIVSEGTLELIARNERDGGLLSSDAEAFVQQALETFRWHGEANVDHTTYEALMSAHALVADIVCFPGPHINHLTPRALDIDAVQAEMVAQGIKTKAFIEGPPQRQVPILLRQTSFHALEEPIMFREGNAQIPGAHTARFGEIEQRGIALTHKGRALYDRLLAESAASQSDDTYEVRLAEAFKQFPDDQDTIRHAGLGYFTYTVTSTEDLPSGSIDALIEGGHIRPTPITYEDFLPVSAAGIFRSNLAAGEQAHVSAPSSQAEFEKALDAPCLDPFDLYHYEEQASLKSLEIV